MKWVIITALSVGGAVLFGALLGFILKDVREKTQRLLSGASAGIMLYSAILGLVLPASECTRFSSPPLLIAGVFCGAAFLEAIGRITPRLLALFGASEDGGDQTRKNALLFLLAMGLHHIPEGIAAGVSFGTGSASDVLAVAGGIALQNIPEGMITVRPMLKAGLSQTKAALLSLLISLLEALGVLLGYFAVSFSRAILPFSLCFAAGTMLYVLLSDMIPAACAPEYGTAPVAAALGGFCFLMLVCAFF